jgi:hypothetical protein
MTSTGTITTTTTTTRRRRRRRRTKNEYSIWSSCFLILVLWGFTNHGTTNTTPFLAVDAYRVGDVVDTAMYTQAFPVELFMANMPLFGVSRRVKIPRVTQRFSITFEEGLHSLPYLDGQMLQTLQVTIIYSRSGEGRIHSVQYEAIRSQNGLALNAKMPIDVEFEWLEEDPVNLDTASTVMFVATLVASMVFLLQLCSVGDSGGNNNNNTTTNNDLNADEYGRKKKGWSSTYMSMGYASAAQRDKWSHE